MSYDEFGVSEMTAGVAQPFGFIGYQTNSVSRLYYAQARYYTPQIGRFTSEDLIKGFTSLPQSLNQYAYCWNQPVNYVDLDGMLRMPQWMRDAGNWVSNQASNAWDTASNAASNVMNGAQNVVNSISNWYNDLPDWGQNLIKIGVGVVAVGVGAAVVVVTGGTAAAFIPALVAGIKTACTVGAVSAGVRAGVTAIYDVSVGDGFNIRNTLNAAVDGFSDGFMIGGIMAGASLTYGSLMRNAGGLQFGTTPKSQYGRVNVGYGNPNTHGNTVFNVTNKMGQSRFRLDADMYNLLHMHYGLTKKAMELHRTNIIPSIVGAASGWFNRDRGMHEDYSGNLCAD